MQLIDAVAQYLGSVVNGLAYSDSTDEGNIFLDALPASPDRAVCVYTMPGSEPDSRLPYDSAEFQIVVRGDPYNTWARDVWARIYSELHGLRNYTLPGGIYVVSILAASPTPSPVGEDTDARRRYSGDYHAEVLNTTRARPM